jgi:hypothetical protein
MGDKKNTLFIYGDSFAVTFKNHFNTDNIWAKKYSEFKNGIIPKHYSEIIAEELGLRLRTMAQGGCSNYTIFDRFCGTFGEHRENDVVIICWTTLNRFPIATNENNLIDIIPFVGHPPQNEHVSLNTTNEIAVNRNTYSCYYSELINYVKIINEISKHTRIIHWTWVDNKKEIISLDKPDFRKLFYSYLVPFKQYETITEETNGEMVDVHYGEKGHIELADNLLRSINRKIKLDEKIKIEEPIVKSPPKSKLI